MNTSENKYDAIEALIFEEGLQISSLTFDETEGYFFIHLNTNAVLKQKLSEYPLLKSASSAELKQYEIIANGTGVHWKDIDEDLSLKGFLEHEIRHLVKMPAAA